jgi:hypothetical protein
MNIMALNRDYSSSCFHHAIAFHEIHRPDHIGYDERGVGAPVKQVAMPNLPQHSKSTYVFKSAIDSYKVNRKTADMSMCRRKHYFTLLFVKGCSS